jgi:hypothetical protein
MRLAGTQVLSHKKEIDATQGRAYAYGQQPHVRPVRNEGKMKNHHPGQGDGDQRRENEFGGRRLHLPKALLLH